MPFLDVTDVLLDPDFVDLSLVCYRQVQTVDEDNFPTNTAQAIPFSGVVTVDRSLEAKRMAAGQNINGAILIVTQFRLTQGQPGLDADIVTYRGRDYRVTFVDPYTAYGAGFVQAHCELLEFDGERRLSNDSTTAGYLTPVGDSPPYDEDLERLISRWIRGVTGLAATLVYPRWTDPQKQIPKNGTTGARSVSPAFRRTSTRRTCRAKRTQNSGRMRP